MKNIVNVSEDWEKEFRRIKNNPIYFLEFYWNEIHKTNPVNLSNEEKQKLFNKYSSAPLLKEDNFTEYINKKDQLEEDGYKDWEIEIILHSL